MAVTVQVLSPDALDARAQAQGVPWGALDDDLRLREALRGHVAAEGSMLRRSLVERALRWHGAPDDDTQRARVHACLDDLDAVGDVLVGAEGLVGAAPVRAARVRGSATVLLLGSVGTDALRRALPGEVVEPRRVRRMVLTRHDDAGLDAALRSIGGRVTDAACWAGLDRAPATPDAWWRELSMRPTLEAAEALAWRGDDVQAWASRDGRGRWISLREGSDTAPRLLRSRQPGGWFRCAWAREDGVCALSGDEALRATRVLELRGGVARVVATSRRAGGDVAMHLPTRVPRAEYRMLLGSAEVTRDASGVVAVASADVWPALAAMLRERLGWVVDEPTQGGDP